MAYLRIVFVVSILVIYFNDCVVCEDENEIGICKHWKPKRVSMIITKTRTFIETYKKSNCVIFCKGKRVKQIRYTQYETKWSTDYIDVCCEGYTKDIDAPELRCIPVCETPCENGDCVSPNTCKCSPGYAMELGVCQPQCSKGCLHGRCVGPENCDCDPKYEKNSSGDCAPMCTQPCINGDCAAPDKCVCHHGFQRVLGECQPVCTDCFNGICVAPSTCQCNPGYASANNTCMPVCTSGCLNGECIEPDICSCNDGYMESDRTCVPHCSNGCPNGKCVEPETCKCDDGFIAVNNNTCAPHCSSECINGWCSSLETCTCDQGYEMVSNTTCKPSCPNGCLNGVCVSPNVCECQSGYVRSNNETCLPHCPEGCVNNSHCTAPEVCTCDPGWIMNSSNICEKSCNSSCTDGTCIYPNTCICPTGYILTMFNDSANCQLICENCDGDAEYETSTEEVSVTVHIAMNNTEQLDWWTADDENETSTVFDDTAILKRMSIDETNSNFSWYLISCAIMALIIVVSVILIWKRKNILRRFYGGSYAVQDIKFDVIRPSQENQNEIYECVS